MFYVYLIKSEKHGTFYIGQTNNVKERLKYHNRGKCIYTRNKGPWRLIACKEFATRSTAMIEEKRIKKLKNRQAVLSEFGIAQAQDIPILGTTGGSPDKSGLGLPAKAR